MKYSTSKITGAVLTTLLLAFAVSAREHNSLNGTWTLIPAKSDFAGQRVVQTGTVTTFCTGTQVVTGTEYVCVVGTIWQTCTL